MSDMISSIPDYLLSALDTEAQTGSVDLFAENPSSMPKLRRVEVPQRNSAKHAGGIGKIYISGRTADEEGEYRDYLDFLLIQSFVFDKSEEGRLPDFLADNRIAQKSLPIGGRTMWPFDEEGKRVRDADAPICTSPNGIEVWRNLVGKEVFDYRTKKTEKIGFDLNEDGTYTRREHSCLGCPLSEWMEIPTGKTDADGNPLTQKFQPMCRQTFTVLIWSVDDQELMTLKMVNLGMQMAVMGAYSMQGRRFDDVPFKGIKAAFNYTGMISLGDSDEKVPAFANRPFGKPSVKNPSAPVYAVRMSATLNNFSPPTIVPMFTVLDGKVPSVIGINPKSKNWVDGSTQVPTPKRILTPEEYVAYLSDQQKVISDDYKSRFMAMNIISRAGQGGIAESLPAPSTAHAGAALPPPTTTADMDDPFGFSN